MAAAEVGIVSAVVPAEVEPDSTELGDDSGDVLGGLASAVVAVPGTVVELTSLGGYFVRANRLTEDSHAPSLEPAPWRHGATLRSRAVRGERTRA